MDHFNANIGTASFLQTLDTTDAGDFDAGQFVYAGSFVLVVALTIGVFFNRGPMVIGGILAYLISLSTMTLTVKSVFVNQQFNHPKFVTSMHFLTCGFLCFGIMLCRQIMGQKRMPVPAMKQLSHIILPIAIAFAASVGANNIALVYCNAAFSEMIGGAAPLCVICINLCEGKGFDMRLLWPVLAVIAGVTLCAVGELKFTWAGLLLVFLACFLRAFKSNLQHKILDNQIADEKLEPVELLAWMSPPCLVVMVIWGGVTEGLGPIMQLAGGKGLEISMAIAVTCVNACVLNVANNFVIRDLGAVGCLLAGQLKGILLLMGAFVMLGEVIQMQQIAGYVSIAGGIYFYNKIEKDIKDTMTEGFKADIENVQEKVPLVK